MKYKLITCILFLYSLTTYAQKQYFPGYYINNLDEKIEGLIKDPDSQITPVFLKFKSNTDSKEQQLNISTVKEFSIYNRSKFIRRHADIDQSSNKIDELSKNKAPIFENQEVFLEVLVEGPISLLHHRKGNQLRFFYMKESEEVIPLIYKKYITNTNEVRENIEYKQQLLNLLDCNSMEPKIFKNIPYSKKRLSNLFITYNNCTSNAYTSYTEGKEKNDALYISVRPRINQGSLDTQSQDSNYPDISYDQQTSFGIGIEFEYILPFSSKKAWGISIEPTYQEYKTTKIEESDIVSGGSLVSDVHYNSIELPVSLRHYINISKKSKLFINASIVLDFPSEKSKIEYNRSDGSNILTFDIKSNSNYGLGIGYKYANRISIEGRILTNRNVLKAINSWTSKYNNASLIIGYQFL